MSGSAKGILNISQAPADPQCQDISIAVGGKSGKKPEEQPNRFFEESSPWRDLLFHPVKNFLGLAKLFEPSQPMASVNLAVSPNSIFFGDVHLYNSASRSFSIRNNGKCDAYVNLTTSLPFTVSNGGLIKAGATAYYNVNFNPVREGTFNKFVTGNHGISIALNGKGVDPYKK